MNLITCNHLTMRYESSFYALKDLNFHVETGDYLYILGQNGAGKSTLIKGLLQLKKPASGEVIYGDGLQPSDIGYLPQTTQVQKDFPASVREVVLSGCLNQMRRRPFYSHKEKRLAAENMERMGITKLQNKCFRELSGGQKQRVLLARALCATKKILLLDEPAAGLDPVVTQEMYEQIHAINQNLGITIIMVSHDMHAALKYAKHILQLHQNQLFYGTTAEYIASDVGRNFIRESEDAGLLDLLDQSCNVLRSREQTDVQNEVQASGIPQKTPNHPYEQHQEEEHDYA